MRKSSPNLDRQSIAHEVGAFIESRRPPERIRKKLDYKFTFHGRTVELVEVRPRLGRSNEKSEHPFAKATFVGTKGIWKVYWMRANLRWYPYEPREVRSLVAFLKIVAEDKHGCFFG